jgi:hypothetical protein
MVKDSVSCCLLEVQPRFYLEWYFMRAFCNVNSLKSQYVAGIFRGKVRELLPWLP